MICREENEIILYPKFTFNITTDDNNCSHYRCQVVCPVSATNSVTIIDDSTPRSGGPPLLPDVPALPTFTRDIDYAALPNADPYLNKTHWVRFEFYYYRGSQYNLLHISNPQAIRVYRLNFIIAKDVCTQSLRIRIKTNALAPLNCSAINSGDFTLTQNNSNLSYTSSVQGSDLLIETSPNPELGDVTLSMNKNCGDVSVSYSTLIPIYYYKYFSFIMYTNLGFVWYVSFKTNDSDVDYRIAISNDLQVCAEISIALSVLSNGIHTRSVNLTNACEWSSSSGFIVARNKNCVCKRDIISVIRVARCRVSMTCNNICFTIRLIDNRSSDSTQTMAIEENFGIRNPNYNITHITIQLETSINGTQQYTVPATYDAFTNAIVGCIENYNVSGFVEVSEATISIYDSLLEQTTDFVLCEMSNFYLVYLDSIGIIFYPEWNVYEIIIGNSFPSNFNNFNWRIILRNLNRNIIYRRLGNASNWSNRILLSHRTFYNVVNFTYNITDNQGNRYSCEREIEVQATRPIGICEFRMNCNNLCFMKNVSEEIYTASRIQQVMITWEKEDADGNLEIEEHIASVSYDANTNMLEACLNNYNFSGVRKIFNVGVYLYYQDIGSYNDASICRFNNLYIIYLNRIAITYYANTDEYNVSILHTFPSDFPSSAQWWITIRDNSGSTIIYQNSGDFTNWSSNITFTSSNSYSVLNFEYQIQIDDIFYSCSRNIRVEVIIAIDL